MRGIVLLVLCVALGSTVATAQTTPADDAADSGHAAPDAFSQGARSHAERSHSTGVEKPGQQESNVDYFWRKSDEAFHDGDFERAIRLHKAIVALDPGDVESYGVAAWLMWSLGRDDEAITHLQRGVKANPGNWGMWNELAQNYDLQKRRPEAFDAYKRAVALVPKEADAHDTQMLRRRLAHAAEKSGDLQTAAETWRALVRDCPDEPVNKNNLARVEKAIEDAKASQTAAALRSTTMIAVPAVLGVTAVRVLRLWYHADHADSSLVRYR